MQVNMHEAKSQLSKLGDKAWNGEEVVIAKAGTPYLDLVPHKAHLSPRTPGRYKGQIRIASDFDQTSEELIALFESDL
ncbi:MAG: type II toxin-antitoxin system prevent-host-death family antitoxin [Pseudomonadota bacterium]